MVKLRSPKLAGRLHELTKLKPLDRNRTSCLSTMTMVQRYIKLKTRLKFLSSDRKLVDLLPAPVRNSDVDERKKLVKLKPVTVALFDNFLKECKEPEFKRYLDREAQFVHCKVSDNVVVKCLSGNLETISSE